VIASAAVFEILHELLCIRATTLTFRDHLMSLVTLPFDSP